MVALELGRKCIGIELNPDYGTLQKRTDADGLGSVSFQFLRCSVSPPKTSFFYRDQESPSEFPHETQITPLPPPLPMVPQGSQSGESFLFC